MSPRDWQSRLEDILESIHNIQLYIEGIDYSTFSSDQKTIDAVLRNLEIIGEASNFIPEDIRETVTDFPLIELRAMRNIIVHHYFGVSLPIIWDTVQNDIPNLELIIRRISDT
jgi:uncharacterized protein with HEPN domain